MISQQLSQQDKNNMGKVTMSSNLKKTSERLDKDGKILEVKTGINDIQQKMNDKLRRLGITPKLILRDEDQSVL